MPCNAHGMAGTPETRYAKDGDSHHLAYQVVGEGPDLLFVPTATFPIDLLWDEPTVAGHLRRLASFSRLILTDLLGTGSSDAVPIHDLRDVRATTISGSPAALSVCSTRSNRFSPAGAGLHTGEVLVSGVIPPLVLGSRIEFTDRGIHELKGVPDRWPVLGVS